MKATIEELEKEIKKDVAEIVNRKLSEYKKIQLRLKRDFDKFNKIIEDATIELNAYKIACEDKIKKEIRRRLRKETARSQEVTKPEIFIIKEKGGLHV